MYELSEFILMLDYRGEDIGAELRNRPLSEQDVRQQKLVQVEFAAVTRREDRHRHKKLRNGEEAPKVDTQIDDEAEVVKDCYNHPVEVRGADHLPFLDVDVQLDVQAFAVHLQLPL